MLHNYYSAQLLEVDTKSALVNHTYSKYVLCLLLAITRPGTPGIVILTIKPEPIMLLNLPIILSRISQKCYLLFSKSIL